MFTKNVGTENSSICIPSINIYVSIWRQIEISGVRRHQADRGAFVSVAGNQIQLKAGRAARGLSSLSLCSRLRKRRPRRHIAAYLSWKAVI